MNLSLKIIPPLQVLLAGLGMWLTHSQLPLIHLHVPQSDSVFRGILVFALAIFCLAVLEFWRHKTTVNPMKIHQTSSLITTGIYRFSRNPIYLADLLILVAWMVWLGAWFNVIWVIGFVIYVTRYQIRPEERVLMEKFPQEWEAYRKRVRRWI